jgi:hypothetical protein
MRAAMAITVLVYAVCTSASMAGVTYSYDTLGRLSKAAYDNGKEIDYTYDPAGNRSQVVTQMTPHFEANLKPSTKSKKAKPAAR